MFLYSILHQLINQKYIGVSALVQKFDSVLCFSFTNRLAIVQGTLWQTKRSKKGNGAVSYRLVVPRVVQWKLLLIALKINPVHLHLQTVHCQPIKVATIALLKSIVCSFLAQLFEPNIGLGWDLLDGVLQLCLDCLPMLGTGHSPSCVQLPVRVLDQHLQPQEVNEERPRGLLDGKPVGSESLPPWYSPTLGPSW